MEGLGINLGYLIVQILAFVFLIIILKGWLYTPIVKVLDERKARIAKGLEDARQASIARDNADAEAKSILEAARTEAAKIRSDATVQAEETAAGITNNANEQAKEIVASAGENAEEERNRILSDLRTQVASIAIAAANKLVGEALDEDKQRELVADFFSRTPAGVAQLSGEKAEVTSALPLTEKEQDQVRKTIKAETIDFRVDPEILGGLVVRVGDQIIDDSVAGQMRGMRESLLR
jgi:F-type H+-transporting ATPase subunit b